MKHRVPTTKDEIHRALQSITVSIEVEFVNIEFPIKFEKHEPAVFEIEQ